MGKLRTITALAVVSAVAVVGAAAGPAFAKGPQEATITAFGIDEPIVVSWASTDTTSFGDLMEQAQYWAAMEVEVVPGTGTGTSPAGTAPVAEPAGDLGPQVKVHWDHGTSANQEHELYPWAEGGPVSFVPAGQLTLGHTRTKGRWYRLNPAIGGTLRRIGVPDRAVLEAAAARAGGSGSRSGSVARERLDGVRLDRGAAASGSEGEGALVDGALAAGAAALLAGGVGGLLVRSRSRRRRPTGPDHLCGPRRAAAARQSRHMP